jgi:diacylglycerol kinase (ATP)
MFSAFPDGALNAADNRRPTQASILTMNLLTVHKPGAGDETTSASDVVRALDAAGHHIVYFTADDDAWKQRTDCADLVVAAGGDGTVGSVMLAVAGLAIPIAVLLPLGTANNIATSLRIDTENPLATIASWPTWHCRKFDPPTAHFDATHVRFVERVGRGIFSDLLQAAAVEKRRHERRVSLTEALRLLQLLVDAKQPSLWTVTIDERDFSGEYLAVEALNISHTGPGIALKNHDSIGNGLTDIAFIDTRHRTLLHDYIDQQLKGREPPAPAISIAQGRTVLLASPNATQHLDDRIIDATNTVHVTTGTDYVTVLTPTGTPLRPNPNA